MTVQEVLHKSIEFLRKKNIESAKLDSELLISDVLKMKRLDLYLKYDRPLNEKEIHACRENIRRRGLGEPVSLVLGHRDFWGINFFVNGHVLTPRSETEELVEHAVEFFNKNFLKKTEKTTVVDLGAGTGCIGLTFLKKIESSKFIDLWLVEKSAEAFSVLIKNTEKIFEGEIIKTSKISEKRIIYLLTHERQITCLCESADVPETVFDEPSEKIKIDFLLSNPPYIAESDASVAQDVLQHEPHAALFAGQEGLEKLKNWSQSYSPFLSLGGYCLMEMGHLQGPEIKTHFEALFTNVRILNDLQGRERFIEAIKS